MTQSLREARDADLKDQIYAANRTWPDSIDKSREMAASFIALADQHAAQITTSDLYTENFVRAFQFAKHMVNGGAYTSGESQIVFTQLAKLNRHFA